MTVPVASAAAGTPDERAPSASAKKTEENRSEHSWHASETARERFIEHHDLRGDGQVGLTEFIEFRTERFESADIDGDGLLDSTEYVDEFAARLDRRLEQERRGHEEQTRRRFEALDADEDGLVSWEEFNASGDRIFSRHDPDGSGRVLADAETDAEEQGPRRPRRLLAMPTTHNRAGFMELYDDSADGVVTREDFDRQRRAQFERSDADGDGTLTVEEYLDEFLVRVDRHAEQVRRSQLEQAERRFDVVDRNGDGVIDLNEYLAVGLRRFHHWDTDGTGVVSTETALPEHGSWHSGRQHDRGKSGNRDGQTGHDTARLDGSS